MKQLLLYLLFLGTLSANAQDSLNIDARLQKKYLTAEMENFYIGMPTDSFFTISNISNTGDISYSKKIQKGNALEITYQCTKDILYEMMVEYKSSYELKAALKKKLGPTNYVNQGMDSWKIKLDDGFTLLIWRYGQKYCVADFRQFDY